MRWANYIGNRCFAIFISILINKQYLIHYVEQKYFQEVFNLLKKMEVGSPNLIHLVILQLFLKLLITT